MGSFNELVKKRVAGVPVLYLAGAFVAILAIVAWKMKPSVSPDEESPDDGGLPPGKESADYSDLETMGTVTVVQPAATPQEAVQQTNEMWARSAIDYLIESKAATPGVAQMAITKYLEGSNLTYDEGVLRDKAITKLKLPPEPLATLGTTGGKPAAPAKKAFTGSSGTHTVLGKNDNTYGALAVLYYGSASNSNIDLLQSKNTKYIQGPFPVGAKIYIPNLQPPKYYTATASIRTLGQIAAKNGMSQTALRRLNETTVFPVKKGTKVRVG